VDVFPLGWRLASVVDFISNLILLGADARLTPDFRQVADFRDVTRLDVTSDGVRRSATNNPWGPDARRAFVAPLDETLGMIRMFGIYMHATAQFQIFRTLEPAMEWIGLDPATPWPGEQPDAVFGEP
jgi:hypothetical protein